MLLYLLCCQRLFELITCTRMFLHLLHLGGTLACNAVGVRSAREASARVGSLALLHLVSLYLTRQFSFAADLFGVSLRTYQLLHQAISLMAVLQTAVHVATVLPQMAFSLSDRPLRYGFIGSIMLAAALVVVLPWVRTWSHELYVHCHSFLSVAALVMVWMHLKRPRTLHRICLFAAAILPGLTSAVHIVWVAFCNLRAHRSLPVAHVVKKAGVVELTFRPSRPWKVCAGQYIYLTVPGLGFWAVTQAHPFYIAWTEDGPDGEAVSVTVIVRVRTGFTQALFLTPHRHLRLIVDGPYGGPKRKQLLEAAWPYDAVTLIATDIGIAGQLLYAKDLLRRFIAEENDMNTRGGGIRRHRINIVWEMKEESHNSWISDRISQLLAEDSNSLVSHLLSMMNHRQLSL
ncbi:hypothetical protein, variant [Blastomyces dermatitidis ATCC 26199]|nr:hypothetical protein, variant [Blastomyces dermatitidis ATCC 26199]